MLNLLALHFYCYYYYVVLLQDCSKAALLMLCITLWHSYVLINNNRNPDRAATTIDFGCPRRGHDLPDLSFVYNKTSQWLPVICLGLCG